MIPADPTTAFWAGAACTVLLLIASLAIGVIIGRVIAHAMGEPEEATDDDWEQSRLQRHRDEQERVGCHLPSPRAHVSGWPR